jgi:hypothetical protein
MKEAKRPLKRSMIGFEMELFTINEDGFIVNGADAIISKLRSSDIGLVKKECAGNMIEVLSKPSRIVTHAMDSLLTELEYLISIADEEGILLCPLATYPGKFDPYIRTDKRYKIQEHIFGKNRFKIAGRNAGFHCHYSLPRGVFDHQMRMLKLPVRSKTKDSLINSFNFLIAADPALTTFMQSSPFYQGRNLGKDSRMIMYRGGKPFNNTTGLYANFQEFGALQPYKLTAHDLADKISSRYHSWTDTIRKIGLNVKILSHYGSMLNTTWNPVKINQNGTLEQRGMDTNHPIYIATMGIVLRRALKKLQEEFHNVVPSEIGIKEPFKMEKDTVYVPPSSYVQKELQYLSAFKGLESDVVYNYCRRFLKFIQGSVPKEKFYLLRSFSKMLSKRKTVSDEILDYARRKGFKKNGTLSHNLAASIALHHSKRLMHEIFSTKKLLKL